MLAGALSSARVGDAVAARGRQGRAPRRSRRRSNRSDTSRSRSRRKRVAAPEVWLRRALSIISGSIAPAACPRRSRCSPFERTAEAHGGTATVSGRTRHPDLDRDADGAFRVRRGRTGARQGSVIMRRQSPTDERFAALPSSSEPARPRSFRRHRPAAAVCSSPSKDPTDPGKTTQRKLFKTWLKAEGYDVVTTKWNSSDLIKPIIKSRKAVRALSPEEFSLLHAADFRHRVEHKILPALWNGQLVIADRFLFTGLARDVRARPRSRLGPEAVSAAALARHRVLLLGLARHVEPARLGQRGRRTTTRPARTSRRSTIRPRATSGSSRG